MRDFLKAYSIKEASELTGVTPGTIRQWSKDFSGILEIPRNEQNARYFTDIEIETLNHIKAMRDKNISIDMIKELLKKRTETGDNSISLPQTSLPALKQTEVTEILRSIQTAFETLPEVKEAIISEIRDELKEELAETVRNEINDIMNIKNDELLLQLKEEKEQKKSIFSNLFRR